MDTVEGRPHTHSRSSGARVTRSAAFTTRLKVPDLARIINDAFQAAGAEVRPIRASRNPLDTLTERALAVAVMGSRQGLVSRWAVRAYVYDYSDRRAVRFVALGDGGLLAVLGGDVRAVSLTKSTRQVERLVAALHAADPFVVSA